MRLIDGDALTKRFMAYKEQMNDLVAKITTCGAIREIDLMPTIEPPTTEWLGNHTPFRCKRCGHYSDSRTPYCTYCGKKAINVANS